MSVKYKPTVWAKRYKRLPRPQKDEVIQESNKRFRLKTGVARALDPQKDQVLCWQWLVIRDDVMAERARSAASTVSVSTSTKEPDRWDITDPFHMLRIDKGLDLLMATGEVLSGIAAAPWMMTARGEHGQKEAAKKAQNPRIIEYIRTCESLWDNPSYKYADKRKLKGEERVSDFEVYFRREGEEVVQWCSAFVNWVMEQNGYTGTNDAEAKSWEKWGDPLPLDEPEVGAIVCVGNSKKRISHVAFLDQVNGEWKMLGGNQNVADASEFPNQVSYRPYNPKRAVALRWPS